MCCAALASAVLFGMGLVGSLEALSGVLSDAEQQLAAALRLHTSRHVQLSACKGGGMSHRLVHHTSDVCTPFLRMPLQVTVCTIKLLRSLCWQAWP